MTCPMCDTALENRGAALWCDKCRVKVETCCEGAAQ